MKRCSTRSLSLSPPSKPLKTSPRSQTDAERHGTFTYLITIAIARSTAYGPRRRRWGSRKCSRPRAPCQNPFVERFIGSARRGCFDHVIVFNETGLKRLMTLYCSYYERSRCHLSLDKDTPIPRPVMPPGDGDIVAIPEVGGLHHRYERRAPERRPGRRPTPTSGAHRLSGTALLQRQRQPLAPQ